MQKNIHAALMLLWAQDQNNNPSQVWQARRDSSYDWRDFTGTQAPHWYETYQYRRKPDAVGVCGSKHHIDAQQQWTDDQVKVKALYDKFVNDKKDLPVWQFRSMGSSYWSDVDVQVRPSWYPDYDYRRKPVPVPVFHAAGRAAWNTDAASSVWQYRKPDSKVWHDLDPGEQPKWFENRDYRKKPVVY